VVIPTVGRELPASAECRQFQDACLWNAHGNQSSRRTTVVEFC
jgi:hypothetical protein